jgi:hypothetical protein
VARECGRPLSKNIAQKFREKLLWKKIDDVKLCATMTKLDEFFVKLNARENCAEANEGKKIVVQQNMAGVNSCRQKIIHDVMGQDFGTFLFNCRTKLNNERAAKVTIGVGNHWVQVCYCAWLYNSMKYRKIDYSNFTNRIKMLINRLVVIIVKRCLIKFIALFFGTNIISIDLSLTLFLRH